MTKKELDIITDWIKWNIARNSEVMFDEKIWDFEPDIVGVIMSLHNLLYEQVTGERYDYMFHWCNKIGADCIDNFFDDIIKAELEKEENV